MTRPYPIDNDVSFWAVRDTWWNDPRGVEAVVGYRRRCDACQAYEQPQTADVAEQEITQFGAADPIRVVPRSYRQTCAACGHQWRHPRVPNIEVGRRTFFFTLSDGHGHVSFSGTTASLLGGPAIEARRYADHLWGCLDLRIEQQQEAGWQR